MSLQFIFGNSGSGKSHYLYHYIVEESIRHPDKNYLVLVPEQFTMQTQKDLCLAHPRGGIMNVDVLSFGRLAHRIFEEVGEDGRQVLDDEGKNLVLRRIAGNYEDELTVLKGNLKKQGYISEVKSVISEFTQYGVDFERLDEFMESLNPDSYLFYKLKDIRKVYEGFEEYLSEKYITKEEISMKQEEIHVREEAKAEEETAVPPYLATEEASRLRERLERTGLVDAHWQPVGLTLAEKGVLVQYIAGATGPRRAMADLRPPVGHEARDAPQGIRQGDGTKENPHLFG